MVFNKVSGKRNAMSSPNSFQNQFCTGVALSSVIPALVAPVVTQPVQAQETELIIHVHPQQGKDQTGTGSEGRPYQTLSHALQQADDNTIIELAPATYSEKTGETFPIVVQKNIEIRGKPKNQGSQVQIKGGGQFNSPTGAGQHVAIVLLSDATLTGVSVTNRLRRGHGVWIEGASPTVTQNSFQRNDNTGLSVNGFGQPTIKNNRFVNNQGNGIGTYGKTQPLVKNNVFDHTGFGMNITEYSSPKLIGNEFRDNRIGIIITENAQPILRDNLIEQSWDSGLVAISNSHPDLGTDQQAGGNTFRRNQGKAIRNLTENHVIPAHGNKIAGKIEGELDFRGTVAIESPPEADLIPQLQQSSQRQEQVWQAPTAASPETSNDDSRPPVNLSSSLPSLSESQILPPEQRQSSSLRDSQQFSAPSEANNKDSVVPSNADNVSPVETPSSPTNRSSDQRRLEDVMNLDNENNGGDQSLPVPGKEIPRGNPVNPNASPNERVAAVGGQYRVIVPITRDNDKAKVKEMVPQAFTSSYQGRSVMQVGIFQSQKNAENIRQKLEQKGLEVRVISVSNN